MRYRQMGTTGEAVSVLGFGCMRLPVVAGRSDEIDTPRAQEMLYAAIDAGVNYVDTAYPYHGTGMGSAGTSEPFVGDALAQGGYRDRVHLATKLPSWLVNERADMDRFLAEQLERLRTDRIDFYLLHSLNGASWLKLRDLGVLEFLDAARADGRIRHAAFSFHGEPEDFAPIADAYQWAFAQIQYNYVDVAYQAGQAGVEHAAARGLGVVVMEPLKGGRLAANLPPAVQAVFDSHASRDQEPVQRALDFVWAQPGVTTLLSGMSTLEQVHQNLLLAEQAPTGPLAHDELAVYARAREALQAGIRADCTACRYCMPCPAGVDIPGVLAKLNAAGMWSDPGVARLGYRNLDGAADLCTECGLCEDACPQGLPIRDLMAEADALFRS